MSVLILLLTFAAGVVLGMSWARWRTMEMLRRLNGERDLRDQAVGADLIRQLDRMRRR